MSRRVLWVVSTAAFLWAVWANIAPTVEVMQAEAAFGRAAFDCLRHGGVIGQRDGRILCAMPKGGDA